MWANIEYESSSSCISLSKILLRISTVWVRAMSRTFRFITGLTRVSQKTKSSEKMRKNAPKNIINDPRFCLLLSLFRTKSPLCAEYENRAKSVKNLKITQQKHKQNTQKTNKNTNKIQIKTQTKYKQNTNKIMQKINTSKLLKQRAGGVFLCKNRSNFLTKINIFRIKEKYRLLC